MPKDAASARLASVPRLAFAARLQPLLVPLASILGALGVGAILIALSGANPVEAYAVLVHTAFGSRYGVTEVIVRASPLLLIGLSVAVSWSAGLWNVGAWGQFYIGALLATILGVTCTRMSSFVLIPLMAVAGILGGCLWAALPAFLKAKLNVDEIVSTLMTNYVAVLFTTFMIRATWLHDPTSAVVRSRRIVPAAILPRLVGTRLHLGVAVPLLVVPVVYVFFRKTTLGYKIRAIGANRRAARVLGMDVFRSSFLAFLIAGGMAGLAGTLEVSGAYQRLMPGIDGGAGFGAIPVALLAGLHPLGILLSAHLFSALTAGADGMQRQLGVPIGAVYAIQALVVLFVLVGQSIKLRR